MKSGHYMNEPGRKGVKRYPNVNRRTTISSILDRVYEYGL